MSSRREVVIADIGDENVLAVLDGLLFVPGNIRIAVLIQSMTCHGAFLTRWGGVDESRRCCLLPTESGGLHRWLANVAKLLLYPGKIWLALMEREESTLGLLMRLRVIDDIIGKRDVAKFASLLPHERFLHEMRPD